MAKNNLEKLADLIEANPKCRFDIDNDEWYMLNEKGEEIARGSDIYWKTSWYSSSNDYGIGVAEALLFLLNKRGFKIEILAV